MSKRNYELVELIRRKASMSAQIVERDRDYGFYSGAEYGTAKSMATIDILLRNGLLSPKIVPLVKLLRGYLNQQRKAFFASVGSTEITKLGFILGVAEDAISAVEK